MTASQWGTFAVGFISVVANIILALWSARSARRSQLSQSEAQRILAIEDRTAEKKRETYMPFLQGLGDMLSQNKDTTEKERNELSSRNEKMMRDFQTSVIVWGSDEVVETFARYRILASHNPPSVIAIRLVVDLEIAMRKDLAWPSTEVDPALIIGMRLNDLDKHPEIMEYMRITLDELYEKCEWEPPVDV